MIDSFAWASIILRGFALVILALVVYRQWQLFKIKSSEPWVKYTLMFLVVLVIANQLFTIGTNFYRGEDGNLLRDIRHISQVFNASSALASAIGWYLLYYHDV